MRKQRVKRVHVKTHRHLRLVSEQVKVKLAQQLLPLALTRGLVLSPQH